MSGYVNSFSVNIDSSLFDTSLMDTANRLEQIQIALLRLLDLNDPSNDDLAPLMAEFVFLAEKYPDSLCIKWKISRLYKELGDTKKKRAVRSWIYRQLTPGSSLLLGSSQGLHTNRKFT